MQITVKRKCKWVLKYIWVYFKLRDGIVDLCYVILVILWIITIEEDVCWVFVIIMIWILKVIHPQEYHSQRSSCLDVILTNVPGYFRQSGILEVGLIDHCLGYTVPNVKLRT